MFFVLRMGFPKSRGVLSLLLLWTVAVMVSAQRVEELTILSADREIDVSSQLVQIITKLKVENTNASPTKTVLFTVEPSQKGNMAYFGASTRDKQGTYLEDLKHNVMPNSIFCNLIK